MRIFDSVKNSEKIIKQLEKGIKITHPVNILNSRIIHPIPQRRQKDVQKNQKKNIFKSKSKSLNKKDQNHHKYSADESSKLAISIIKNMQKRNLLDQQPLWTPIQMHTPPLSYIAKAWMQYCSPGNKSFHNVLKSKDFIFYSAKKFAQKLNKTSGNRKKLKSSKSEKFKTANKSLTEISIEELYQIYKNHFLNFDNTDFISKLQQNAKQIYFPDQKNEMPFLDNFKRIENSNIFNFGTSKNICLENSNSKMKNNPVFEKIMKNSNTYVNEDDNIINSFSKSSEKDKNHENLYTIHHTTKPPLNIFETKKNISNQKRPTHRISIPELLKQKNICQIFNKKEFTHKEKEIISKRKEFYQVREKAAIKIQKFIKKKLKFKMSHD